jgi:hypothetical protein
MRFLTIFFVFYLKKYNTDCLNLNMINNLNTLQVLTNKNKTSGYDYRYPINETNLENNCDIYKIQMNLNKKRVLDILQDKNVSINTKLDLIKDNGIKPPNIFAGGLMKDFDFN